MNRRRKETGNRRIGRWAMMLALTLLLCCAGPGFTRAEAAKWMEPYLEQVVDWGVMRGDAAGNLNPDRVITRAEFVVMMNRAFGYTEAGPNSFSDVPDSAWYAQDMAIAKKAGYFNGSAEGLAKPSALVTREQAAAMLGRCLRIKGDGVLNTHFTDNKAIGPWSRGMVQECADMGIIRGYEDGSFRPKNRITRGQMACFLTRALGTRISEPGEQSAGGVYGNLTITSPGVTLKNTTISGNLYLTGGVNVESLVLENVVVMGKIIIAGGGEAQKGESSVILRNVTAQGLEVDNMQGTFLSIRSEGLTNIGTTTIRSSSFVEDVTDKGYGLHFIQLEGKGKTELHLAGNIKEVINRTPQSSLIFGQGAAQKVTIDETAKDSTVRVDSNVSIGEINLDTAAQVGGSGSVSHVNVNSPGSKVEMLPDTITVRPGITADINKEIMDTIIAEESSEDPRIISGYPTVRNISPKGADAVFAGNKKGTIHWALTALTDGSLNQDELLNPQNYKNKIIASGSLSVTAAKTEIPAKLSNLVVDGSYYVSALLTDNRGRHSQVKITAFTTPDDTTPNFAVGYPKAEAVKDGEGKLVIQTQVMPTKDCRLYYALMPKGATAPTPNDFKTGSLSGTLGWGQVDLHKNVPHLVSKVNSVALKEQTDYDLYLWLSDVDNGKSSSVKKITIKTPDMTPPKLVTLTQTDVKDKSVTFDFSIDEPGTLYWAVVKSGKEFFAPNPDGTPADRNDLLSKMQIESGSGVAPALKKGSVSVNKGLAVGHFNITGLEPQTSYDLYFVAKDKAGNYMVYPADMEMPLTFKTLDNEPPTVKQEFTHDGSKDPARPTPYPDTSIRLVFSEQVRGKWDDKGKIQRDDFKTLYDARQDSADDMNAYVLALKRHIRFFLKPDVGEPINIGIGDAPAVDFSKTKIEIDGDSGEMIFTFPDEALKLESGSTYYIELEGICDTSPAENMLPGERGITKLPEFTTIDAQLYFSGGEFDSGTVDGVPTQFDMTFQVKPIMAENVPDSMVWDLLFWTDAHMEIQLYQQSDNGSWAKVGEEVVFEPTSTQKVNIRSMTKDMKRNDGNGENFEQLNKFQTTRNYGVVVTKLGRFKDRGEWSGDVKIDLMAISGNKRIVSAMTTNLTPEKFEQQQQSDDRVKIITAPNEKFPISCSFADTTPPKFRTDYPKFTPGDSGVSIDIALDRGGTKFYYVITEPGNIGTSFYTNKKGNTVNLTKESGWSELPQNGTELATDAHMGEIAPNVVRGEPDKTQITNPDFVGDGYVTGSGNNGGNAMRVNISNKLKADTDYVIYFVLQGGSQDSVSDVYAFRFHTERVVRPILSISLNNPVATVFSKDKDGKEQEAQVKYLMVVKTNVGDILSKKMGDPDIWDEDAANKAQLTAEEKAAYKKLNLIQAMERTHKYQGSVFDLFAKMGAQTMVSSWVNSVTTGDGASVLAAGNMDLNYGNHCQVSEDCKKHMSGGREEYWFLAMGQSPLGSGYAFAAAGFLFYPQNEHPMVTSISTEISQTFLGNGKPTPTGMDLSDKPELAKNMFYSGTITITFSDNLYFNDENTGIIKQVVDGTVTDRDKYVAAASLMKADKVQIKPNVSQNTDYVDTLILTFDKVSGSGGATFNFNSRICSKRGIVAKVPLSITTELVKDKDGFYAPKFVITDLAKKDWEATTIR